MKRRDTETKRVKNETPQKHLVAGITMAPNRLLSRLATLERENQGINRDGFRKGHAEDA